MSQYVVISPDPTVKSLLAKRGFRLIGQGDDSKLLIPKVGDLTADGEFHDFYGNYTFRKILRYLVAKGGSARIGELESICAETKLQDFHDFLARSQLIRTGSDDLWELEVNVDSWGYTVEWYVSRLMSDKLDSISQWGVKIDGLYAGGDYDVLSFVDGILIYTECKSKKPNEISEGEIRNFLQRVQDLAPEIAIMLVDTENQLTELVQNFVRVLLPIEKLRSGSKAPGWKPAKPIVAKLEGFNELYFYPRQVFIANSQPSILHSIQDCLRHYYTRIRLATYFSYVQANYLKGILMD